MGTNFYARIIPTKKRKSELIKLIESEDFEKIKNEINKTFGSFELDYNNVPVGGEIHLGKRSAGWKFLWNPNIYIIKNGHLVEKCIEGRKSYKWVSESDTAFYLYPLTKEGIKKFIDRKDVVIYDEYGKKQDKDTFFKEAVEWVEWNGEEAWDSKSYEEYEKNNNPKWKTYICSGEYVDLLKKEGFKMISETNSDFYSDGLRFATNNKFC